MASQDRKGKVPFLNGAAMIFEKNHSFIRECIEKFTAAYNPKRFGTVGPELLWKTYQDINVSNSKSPILPHLLESKVFYPVRFRSHTLKSFFAKVAPPNQLPWFDVDTIGVHFWGHLSTRFNILQDSKGGLILEHCDDVKFLKSLTQRSSNTDDGGGSISSKDSHGGGVDGDGRNGSGMKKMRKRKKKDTSEKIEAASTVIKGQQYAPENMKTVVADSSTDASTLNMKKKAISSVSAGGSRGKNFKSGANGWFP